MYRKISLDSRSGSNSLKSAFVRHRVDRPQKTEFSQFEPILQQNEIFRPSYWLKNWRASQRSQLCFLECIPFSWTTERHILEWASKRNCEAYRKQALLHCDTCWYKAPEFITFYTVTLHVEQKLRLKVVHFKSLIVRETSRVNVFLLFAMKTPVLSWNASTPIKWANKECKKTINKAFVFEFDTTSSSRVRH